MSFNECNKCHQLKAKQPFKQCFECNQIYKKSFNINDYESCILCSKLTKKPFKKCYTCKDINPPEKI